MFDRRAVEEGGGPGARLVRPGADRAAETAERLEAVVAEAQAAATVARTASDWSAAQRARAIASLDRAAGVLATVRAQLLVAEQRAETSVRTGDRDFVAARARLARSGLGEARREVRQAEALVALPRVADAVAAGRVPMPHVDALARAVAAAGEQATATLTSDPGQARLVRLAERLSSREFEGEVARIVAAAEPAALERSVDAQRRERFLILSRLPDGVRLRGRLDVVSGAALRAALDAVGIAPDASRDKQQSDADALVALAERAVSGMAGVRARRRRVADADTLDGRPTTGCGAGQGRAAAGSAAGAAAPGRERCGSAEESRWDTEQDAADARVSGSAQRPLVSILVPAETFAEVHAARRRAAGDTAPGEIAPVEPATLEDGTPLSMSQLARALCDCEVGRVVLDADSLPLDLGRTSRLFSAAQRRAVIIRDRACAWNGCDVPAAYSEVHHIRWWDRDDGPSDLENAVLLCSHHHHVVHRHDLDIRRLRGPASRSGARAAHAGGAAPARPAASGGASGGVSGRTGPPGPRREPMRYVFTAIDGRVISAPQQAVHDPGDGVGDGRPLFEVA